MIKRTSKQYIEKILSDNPNWKILDIGCGESANKHATTICDVLDLSNFYKSKSFVRLTEKKLPFNDKQFDFAIASHVVEHVDDVSFFLKELCRVAKKGYIEVPTKLEDNLVFGNEKAHIWHLVFDDVTNELLISKKVQLVNPILTVGMAKNLQEYFKESLIIELMWDDKIEFKIINNDIQLKKISNFNFIKKYFSKRFRDIIKILKFRSK